MAGSSPALVRMAVGGISLKRVQEVVWASADLKRSKRFELIREVVWTL